MAQPDNEDRQSGYRDVVLSLHRSAPCEARQVILPTAWTSFDSAA